LAKPDPKTAKKEERRRTRNWVITIFFATIAISAAITLVSDFVMGKSSMGVAFLILLLIVFIGILFDIVGMAVATADEKPFHAMASRKVAGARECIRLLRNAERVSSICNDVVGDICGVVSGSASATIAAQVLANFELSFASVVPLVLSSLVAALTVGGKAVGKGIAVKRCTDIVYLAGRVIYGFTHVTELFCFRKGQQKKKK
jgi:CBS domain containing-hemolysin-like protein